VRISFLTPGTWIFNKPNEHFWTKNLSKQLGESTLFCMMTCLAAFFLGWGLCGTAIAQSASLLVLSKRDHTLAIVDDMSLLPPS
jgi:hypothetical protein